MGKRAFGFGLMMAALVAMSGTAQAITLTSATPDSGTFLGGTPVVLAGNFTVIANTNTATTFQVTFSQDATLGGNDDRAGVVIPAQSTTSRIVLTTPAVPAPGTFNVFVRATNNGQTQTSTSIPFVFLGADDDGGDPTVSLATSVSENFALIAGPDGSMSASEAAAFGITAAQFEDLDTDGDGQVTQDELDAIIAGPTGCDRFRESLAGLVIFGILGILLAIWQGLQNLIFGRLNVFPGNPGPAEDGSDDELNNP